MIILLQATTLLQMILQWLPVFKVRLVFGWGDLYRRIKHQILLAILTSKLMHSFRFEICNILKGSLALLKIQKAPLLQLEGWLA